MGKKLGELKNAKVRAHILRLTVMFFMIVFMVVPVYRNISEKNVQCDYEKLNEGWTVVVRDLVYYDVTVGDFYFDITNKGDQISMERTLPEENTISSPILCFYSVHSVVDVYLDDLLIYTYGHDFYEKNELLGYGNHYIDIDEDYAGKKLRIELLVTENNAFDGIPAPELVDGNHYFQKELAGRRVNLVISAFLIMFGLIVMILSVFMINSSGHFEQTFCIAMFSFLIGCWTLCNSDLISMFTTNLRVKVYMEYMTLYVLPIPFVFYFKSYADDKRNPFLLKMFFYFIVSLACAFAATAYLCQTFNICHYPDFLAYCHLLMLLCIIYVAICFVLDYLHKQKLKREGRGDENEKNVIVIGIGIAILGVVYEMVKYNFSKFFVGFADNKYSSTLCFAVLVVVLALLLDFGKRVTKNMYKDAQRQLLEQMAYMDELTGLANRRKCEETLEEYKEQNLKYAVISLDLNLLKKVNDTQGHDMGDAMLKKFADCLREVYELHGTIGRMGGDEFIVILPKMDEKEANQLIRDMEDNMFDKNIHDDEIKLSTAYGLAISDEVPVDSDSHAAYRLADGRMYENKRLSKMGRT